MKNLKIIIAMILVVSASSCKKLLNKEPTDFLSPVNYYNTEEDLNFALNAVYSRFITSSMYGADLWSYFDISDEMFWSLTSVTSTLQPMQGYGYNASTPEILGLWQDCYKGIGDANALLANIDKPTMDETKRTQIKGEALFLRAYYYFILVQNFGDVPLVLEPVLSLENIEIPRTPLNDVYNQILKDMEAAESMVVAIKTLSGGGRLNKSAVRGILARVCLRMAGYPSLDKSKNELYLMARDWAKKVIDDTEAGHDLNKSYEQIFINYAQDKYDTKESIWEVEFWGNRQDVYVSNGRLGVRNGIKMRNEDTGIGYCFGQMSALGRQYRRYEVGDMRRDWAIAPFSYSNSGAKNNFASTSLYNRNVAKWRREFETLVPKNKNYSPQNFPILRFADVLLMYAEAENEIDGGNIEEVVKAINRVRRRAWGKDLYGNRLKEIKVVAGGTGYAGSTTTITITGGGGSGATATATTASGKINAINITNGGSFYTSNPTITITGAGTGATATATIASSTDYEVLASQKDKASLKELLREERSRELCFEGIRKMDLMRYGTFVNTMKQVSVEVLNEVPTTFPYAAQSGKNITDAHLLLPIPTYELTLNRKLVQNPGW